MTKKLKKVRVQLRNENTGELMEDVDILTSNDCVFFEDGKNYTQKFSSPEIKGEAGIPGKDSAVVPSIKISMKTKEPEGRVTATKSGTKENPLLTFVVPKGLPDNRRNMEAIKARKTAAGEVFNSLGERIDTQINRLKNGIDMTDITLQEDYCYGINNTIDGFTADMYIEGETVKNLAPAIFKEQTLTATKDDFYKNYGEYSFPVKEGNTYTVVYDSDGVYGEVTGQDTVQLFVYKKDNPAEIIMVKSFRGTFQAKSTGDYCIRLDVNKNGMTHTFKDIMILEGDWTSKKIPKYFQGISSVGDKDTIEIKSCAKNLWKDSKTPIRLKKGIKYKLSSEFTEGGKRAYITGAKENDITVNSFYYKYGKFNLRSDRQVLDDTIVCNNDCEIILTTHIDDHNSHPEYVNTFIREGVEETPYEKYKENVISIPMPPQVEGGLKRIGKIRDEIVAKKDGIYLVQRIGKVVVNGSAPIRKITTSNPSYYRWILYNGSEVANIQSTTLITTISDKYNSVPTQNTWGSNGFRDGVSQNNSGGQILLYLNRYKNGLPDSEAAIRKSLQENPATIYFVLAQPKEYKLVDVLNINLKTYKGITHICSVDDTEPILSFKAFVEAQKTLEKLTEDSYNLKKNIELQKEENQRIEEKIDLALLSFKNAHQTALKTRGRAETLEESPDVFAEIYEIMAKRGLIGMEE